mmetsp:Transcript_10468/g.14790  ORF Transcript_10468/g.14790 Transcript_10468/m.14790 type:complete len:230 (+) Transcript_10468:245-934(+)
MKWATYGAKIYNLIEHRITADGLSRVHLREFEDYYCVVDEHDDPENLPSISKSFGITKALDSLPAHLRERFGVSKVPLAYIIRDNVAPIDLEPLDKDRITYVYFESIVNEMILTVPHAGPNFKEDNAKIFQIISDIVADSLHKASIKAHCKTRNGRGAYLSLNMHTMASYKWDCIIDYCKTYLLKREWNRWNYRFTLKSHIGNHREAHNELTRASDFVTYKLWYLSGSK